jgi:hypothetical protein
MITGKTPDISTLAEFRWYQWIKWFNQHADLPDEQEVYGRYLGPSRAVGSLMTSTILNEKGNILHRSSAEEDNPEEMAKRKAFDQKIGDIVGPNMQAEDIPEDETPEHERYEDEDSTQTFIEGRDDVDQQIIDMYLHAEVLLPSPAKC